MRSFLAAIVALSAAFVVAQDATDLPQCSLQCFIQYVPQTGCQLTDYACQCTTAHQNQIRNDITQCVMKSCTDQQDQINTLQTTNAICAKYGPSSSGGAAATSAPSGGSSNSSSGSSGGLAGLGGGATTASSSSSIVMGPQASYFTAAAQPLQTAGALAGAAVAAAAMAML